MLCVYYPKPPATGELCDGDPVKEVSDNVESYVDYSIVILPYSRRPAQAYSRPRTLPQRINAMAASELRAHRMREASVKSHRAFAGDEECVALHILGKFGARRTAMSIPSVDEI